MKQLTRYCTNNECHLANEGRMTAYDIYGILQGEETPFGPMANQLKVRCTSCGHEALESIPSRTKRKLTFPYYHPGYDVNFESESHQDKWMKANGAEYI